MTRQTRRALLAEQAPPYRPDVPRAPKNFQIAWGTVEPLDDHPGYLRTGPDTAVPSRFEASFSLVTPPASVTLEVFVGADLRPRVAELAIRSNVQTPITTSVLRRVLVDQLLREALTLATVPAADQEKWITTRPQETRHPDEDENANIAATIYAEAVASGSRAPTKAVALSMGRSRAQAARYIRRARELGLIPAWES